MSKPDRIDELGELGEILFELASTEFHNGKKVANIRGVSRAKSLSTERSKTS